MLTAKVLTPPYLAVFFSFRPCPSLLPAGSRPTAREKFATQLMEAIPTTPAQFRAKIDADLARWTPVIKAIDIKVN